MREMLTIKEVARLFDANEGAISTWRKNGWIRGEKTYGHVYIDAGNVMEILTIGEREFPWLRRCWWPRSVYLLKQELSKDTSSVR